jgi:hypothetical protein
MPLTLMLSHPYRLVTLSNSTSVTVVVRPSAKEKSSPADEIDRHARRHGRAVERQLVDAVAAVDVAAFAAVEDRVVAAVALEEVAAGSADQVSLPSPPMKVSLAVPPVSVSPAEPP